jgi:hypothetical protein
MIDPIALATGVGIEAVAAKTSITMRALAINIAKANTRAFFFLSLVLNH